jgi:hypothetical protein
MRNTAQFFRIKWKEHNLTVEAYVSGGDVDIESIEGISAMDMYFECIGGNVGEIETLVAESNASQEIDEDGIYEQLKEN